MIWGFICNFRKNCWIDSVIFIITKPWIWHFIIFTKSFAFTYLKKTKNLNIFSLFASHRFATKKSRLFVSNIYYHQGFCINCGEKIDCKIFEFTLTKVQNYVYLYPGVDNLRKVEIIIVNNFLQMYLTNLLQ